jgi:hypothetical protein
MVKRFFICLSALLVISTAVYLAAQTSPDKGFFSVNDIQMGRVNVKGVGTAITSHWAQVVPTLDGVISPGEWSDAATFDISNTGAGISAGTVTLYVKNDGTNIYLAIDDTNDTVFTAGGGDQLGVYFDDVGGTPPVLYDNAWTNTTCGNATGEGRIVCGNFSPASTTPVFEEWISGPTACSGVTTPPGVSQGISNTSGHVQYEATINLTTSAFNVLPGETVGISFYSYDGDGGTPTVTGEWPLGVTTNDPSTYGNLILAQPHYLVHSSDFDGNGTDDISVWRPSNGTWYIQGQFAWTYGTSGDIPVPGDYNGLGQADIAVWRPSNGTWYIRYTETGTTKAYTYGTTGDIPVPGDYNGDGTTDIAVWRPSNGIWYVRGIRALSYGTAGDMPVPYDVNGDGTTNFVVWRPSNGTWYSYGFGARTFGTSGDIPAGGDFNGDGWADGCLFRPSNGIWYIAYGASNQTKAYTYGKAGDIPVPGDYDGDGTTEIAVFRPSNGIWYIRGISAHTFGTQGDYPAVR